MSTKTTEFVATVTGEADSALAALEKVKVRVKETGAAAASANTKIADSTDRLVKGSEKAARGIAAITNAAYALEAEGSARVLAFGGSLGNVVDLLGPQGKLLSGAAILTTAIVALFMKAKEKSAEATKAIEEDIARLVNAGDFAALTKKLQEIEQGTAGSGFTDGRATARERIAQLENELQVTGKVSRYYRERQAQLIDERKKLADLTDQWNKYNKAVTDPRTSARAPRGLAGAIVSTTADSPEKAAKDLERNADEVARTMKALTAAVKKEAADSAAAVRKGLEATNEALQKRNEFTIAQKEDADASARQQRKRLEDLQAELRAVSAGATAYDAFKDAQARKAAGDAAVEEARVRLLKEGKTLTDQQAIDLRASASFAYDLEQSIRGAVDALKGSPAGRLASELADIAESALQIVAATGDWGANLGRALSIAKPLFDGVKSLQLGMQKRDKSGNLLNESVGLLDSLRGRNGAESKAQSIAGLTSIVGTVAAVADAIDLFGTRAKEQNRRLRELAVQFNRALDDFLIKSSTQLQQGVEANFRQAQQLALDLGSMVKWDVGDISSIDDIRRVAKEIDDFANLFKDPKLRDPWKETAAQFRKIAADADANVASLKRLNAEEERRATEDAEVRRLVAAGLNAEASARRLWLEQQREIEAAQAKFGADSPYLTALRETHRMETALAEAIRRRVAVQQRVSDDDVFLGGDIQQRIQRWWSGFVESFGMGADILNGVDLSDAGSLKGVRDAIVNIYKTLSADGVDETERAIIDYLKSILPMIDDAIADIGNAIDPIAQYMDAFAERVGLFGTSLGDQLNELTVKLQGAYGGVFDDLLANADLSTNAGRENFKSAISTMLADILADDVVSEAEQPIYNILKTLLGIAEGAIDAAAADAAAAIAEAERLEQEAADARARQRKRASDRIALFNLEGLDAFRETILGYGDALSGLLAAFDLTSAEGIEGAQQNLQRIFESLEDMSDDAIMQAFGLTRDELVNAILDAGNGLDGLAETLLGVAKNAAEAAAAAADLKESINLEYLDSQGQGRAADEARALAKRNEKIKRATEAGLGQAVLDQIESIYQSDLRAIAQEYAEKALSAASSGGSAGVDAGGGSTGGAVKRPSNTNVVSDIATISDVAAQSLAGLLREIAVNTGSSGALVAAIKNLPPIRPLSSLPFPAFPTSTAGAGGTTIVIGPITVHIGTLDPAGLTPQQAGAATADSLVREVGKRTGQRVRFNGSAVA